MKNMKWLLLLVVFFLFASCAKDNNFEQNNLFVSEEIAFNVGQEVLITNYLVDRNNINKEDKIISIGDETIVVFNEQNLSIIAINEGQTTLTLKIAKKQQVISLKVYESLPLDPDENGDETIYATDFHLNNISFDDNETILSLNEKLFFDVKVIPDNCNENLSIEILAYTNIVYLYDNYIIAKQTGTTEITFKIKISKELYLEKTLKVKVIDNIEKLNITLVNLDGHIADNYFVSKDFKYRLNIENIEQLDFDKLIINNDLYEIETNKDNFIYLRFKQQDNVKNLFSISYMLNTYYDTRIIESNVFEFNLYDNLSSLDAQIYSNNKKIESETAFNVYIVNEKYLADAIENDVVTELSIEFLFGGAGNLFKELEFFVDSSAMHMYSGAYEKSGICHIDNTSELAYRFKPTTTGSVKLKFQSKDFSFLHFEIFVNILLYEPTDILYDNNVDSNIYLERTQDFVYLNISDFAIYPTYSYNSNIKIIEHSENITFNGSVIKVQCLYDGVITFSCRDILKTYKIIFYSKIDKVNFSIDDADYGTLSDGWSIFLTMELFQILKVMVSVTDINNNYIEDFKISLNFVDDLGNIQSASDIMKIGTHNSKNDFSLISTGFGVTKIIFTILHYNQTFSCYINILSK